MKELLKLLSKLGGDDYVFGGKRDTDRTKEGKLCTLTLIQSWLVEKHKIIVVISPSVTKAGIEYKYTIIDARTGFYNMKAASKYIFNSYNRVLEAGVMSALTYLQ